MLGVIADDMTGATDVALALQNAGLRVALVIGVPSEAIENAHYLDAVVVALKSRTAPVSEAVGNSLSSCEALLAAGASQILFKYCSTFDSTARGNIGPVADALLERLGACTAVVCPAFPANGRTIYQGHLFVGADPLDESPMRDHPLTPMRDSSLVRLMAAQTRHRVGLIPLAIVADGEEAIRAAIRTGPQDARYLVVDAIDENHLLSLGRALHDAVLVTGGSGIAIGLCELHRRAGHEQVASRGHVRTDPPRRAILSGSCSAATRAQTARAIEAGVPQFTVDPMRMRGSVGDFAAAVYDWVASQDPRIPVLITSDVEPRAVEQAQSVMGRDLAGKRVESTLAEIAHRLVEAGFDQLIIAGGETSGAVIHRLGARSLTVRAEIDPGVPWMRIEDGPCGGLMIALKSGNFGQEDMFLRAWDLI